MIICNFAVDMGTDSFKFKQFEVCHDKCGMKVGTDGVLLGAWAVPPPSAGDLRVLDVGTGSGLIALMLAQRFESASVTAIDIDQAAVAQARGNVAASPFGSRIEVVQCDFRSFSYSQQEDFSCSEQEDFLCSAQENFLCPTKEQGYDLVVSNPPFYVEDTFCPDSQKNAAKHASSLPFRQLINGAARVMGKGGTLSVIVPYSVANDFIGLAALSELYLQRRCDVRSSMRKPFKRSLLSFSTIVSTTERTELTLRDADNQYTEAYRNLTREFYLGME